MKFLRTLLLRLLLLVLLALFSWGISLYADWPLWAAAAVFIGVLGVYFLVLFLKRMFLVVRSRSLISRQDARARADARNRSPETLLKRKWQAAVATLRASSLKRHGNPLYVLPWYMVIGRSGDGKTSALTRSRLALPIQRLKQADAIPQTLNCDWWYFEKSIVLDCAGRYVDVGDVEQDRREWELGLDLLARYRAREGINGLVLAISAERLANGDRDALGDEAVLIRERIEQLIRLFGKRFPIYVLVTKCDRLYGFETWAGNLAADKLGQAMGYLGTANGDTQSDAADRFIDDAFDSVLGRLQRFRLLLIDKNPGMATPLLMFPRELETIKDSLRHFVQASLGDNPYLESPFLRGMFFSSARQTGGAQSRVLGTLPAVPPHPDTHDGLFLHDLFGDILPRDRHIALPTRLRSGWRTMTQNLGLVGWLLLALAIALLMTIAFLRNVDTLDNVRSSYPLDATFVGDLNRDSETLLGVSRALEELEKRNDHPLAQWMADTTRLGTLEERFKQHYQDRYRRYILPSTEGNFHASVAPLLEHDPQGRLPLLILSEVRYINLIGARIGGADHARLTAMPRIPYDGTQPRGSSPAQLHERLVDLFISHLAWQPADSAFLSERLNTEQAALNRMAYRGQPLAWLLPLVPLTQPDLPPVTLSEFWTANRNDTPQLRNPASVPPVFTRAGARQVDALLAEFETATNDGPRFLVQREAFRRAYLAQRLQAWRDFVTRFPEGDRLLHGESEWRNALGTITGDRSPYFLLIDRLAEEFGDVPADARPLWLSQAIRFAGLRREERLTRNRGDTSRVVGAINSVGGSALRQTLGGELDRGQDTIRARMQEVETLRAYLAGVDKTALEAGSGPGKAYQAAADFYAFGIDPAAEKASTLDDAARSLDKLRKLDPPTSPEQDDIWRLIAGPLHFTMGYINQQASCALQADWDTQVLWPLQTLGSTEEAVDALYGVEGSVWHFVEGPAKPFLQRDANRFSIRSTMGYSVPFTQPFLPSLNTAVGKRVEQLVAQQQQALLKQRAQQQAAQADLKKKQAVLEAQQKKADAEAALAAVQAQADALRKETFPLALTAQPTGVNAGARAQPYLTALSVQCVEGARTLNNYNFPVSDRFTWSPAQCGDVELQIRVDQLTLSKKYPGPYGMVRFLRDLRDGRRAFLPAEFPDARARLEALNIRQLTVRFDFEGTAAIVENASQLDKLAQTTRGREQAVKQAQQALAAAELQAVARAGAAADDADALTVAEAAPAERMPSSVILKQVALPHRIGACWNSAAQPARSQTLQQMFKELTTQASTLPRAPGTHP